MAACFRYIVTDVNAAIEFYTKQLGFKLEMHPAPPFAEVSRDDMHIYLTQPFRMGGGAPMPSGEEQKCIDMFAGGRRGARHGIDNVIDAEFEMHGGRKAGRCLDHVLR